jgi:hypothetical protein
MSILQNIMLVPFRATDIPSAHLEEHNPVGLARKVASNVLSKVTTIVSSAKWVQQCFLLRTLVTAKLTNHTLECPQKVQTIQTLTL